MAQRKIDSPIAIPHASRVAFCKAHSKLFGILRVFLKFGCGIRHRIMGIARSPSLNPPGFLDLGRLRRLAPLLL
ncbi:hypothetical protein [Azospirillum melinis]